MKQFIVLILAIILSCAPFNIPAGPRPIAYTKVEALTYSGPEFPIYISKDFGVEDQLHIDDAINAWNYVLNGSMTLVIKSRTFDMEISTIQAVLRGAGGLIIIPVNSKDCPFLPATVHPDQMNVAWGDLSTHHEIYIVRDRLATQDIFGVTLHEVGHILGAEHYDHYGLMNPTFNLDEYKCIDSDTVDQVAKFNHLKRQYLNSCTYL